MNDPWANDPYSPDDEPVDDPWATDEPWAHGAVNTDPEIDSTDDKKGNNTLNEDARTMNADGTEISVTLKQHGGFDSPWIVLRAMNAADAKKALQEIVQSELTKAAAWAASEFAKTKPGNAAPTAAPQRPQATNQAPQGGGSDGGGDGRSCQHGQMVYRTGTNKFGKPYEAYFCGTPKGTEGQCKAQFV